MSGGSFNHGFNYLCFADVPALFEKHRNDLSEMSMELTRRGYKDVALETERLIAYMEHAERQIEARRERLAPIWKAVEWVLSCDSGPDAIEEAVRKYREA